MGIFKISPAVLLMVAIINTAGCRTVEPAPAPVLMVCEHGSVKSLMAASLFNQAAVERRLPYRAIARGVNPDPSVPAPIAAALAQEGIDVKEYVPTRFSGAEVAGASRVIAIGVDPVALSPAANVPIDSWSDVPAASVNYGAARDSLKQHVDALLNEMQRKPDR